MTAETVTLFLDTYDYMTERIRKLEADIVIHEEDAVKDDERYRELADAVRQMIDEDFKWHVQSCKQERFNSSYNRLAELIDYKPVPAMVEAWKAEAKS